MNKNNQVKKNIDKEKSIVNMTKKRIDEQQTDT